MWVLTIDQLMKFISKMRKIICRDAGHADLARRVPTRSIFEMLSRHTIKRIGLLWVALVLVACQPDAGSPLHSPLTTDATHFTVFLPQRPRPPLGQTWIYPAARTEGNIELIGRCLRLSQPSSTSYLIIWPSDARLQINGSETLSITVLTSNNPLHIGDSVVVGGGEYEPDANLTIEPISTECLGPFWLASSVTLTK